MLVDSSRRGIRVQPYKLDGVYPSAAALLSNNTCSAWDRAEFCQICAKTLNRTRQRNSRLAACAKMPPPSCGFSMFFITPELWRVWSKLLNFSAIISAIISFGLFSLFIDKLWMTAAFLSDFFLENSFRAAVCVEYKHAVAITKVMKHSNKFNWC